MLARFNNEELEEIARKAKVTSQMPLKAPVALVPTKDDEKTSSGLIFPRKRKAIIVLTEHSPFTQPGCLPPCVSTKSSIPFPNHNVQL